MQIDPQEYYTIVRLIERHTDTNTYYVRAVIRNSRTDDVIDTVDLVDQGDRRFTYPYQVPNDPSGHGLQIDIKTTIYTDTDYTIKSPIYGEKSVDILISKRWEAHLGGGGGGVDIDYKKIQKMIDAAKIKIPAQQQTNLQPIMALLRALVERIQGIKIPENDVEGAIKAIKMPNLDTKPLEKALVVNQNNIKELFEEVKSKIDKIPTALVDLGPITEKLEDIKEENPTLDEIKGAFDETVEKINDENAQSRIDDALDAAHKSVNKSFGRPPVEKKEPEPEQQFNRKGEPIIRQQ